MAHSVTNITEENKREKKFSTPNWIFKKVYLDEMREGTGRQETGVNWKVKGPKKEEKNELLCGYQCQYLTEKVDFFF